MGKLKTALLIPDTHRPFHDERAYNLMLKVAKDLRPDEIVIMGDYADFYSINKHGAKHPLLPAMLKQEIDSVNEGLDELDLLFPRAKKVFIEGNHEYRLDRFLVSDCPSLYGMIDCRTLFKMDRRSKWEWVEYEPTQSYSVGGSRLHARHEPFTSTPKGTLARALVSLCYGHTHRIDEGHLVGLDGTELVAFGLGWLGDKSNPVYRYVKGHHQWQVGFAIVHIDPRTGYFYHHKIHILDNYTCVYNGKTYRG